jgi:hypothetical protein
MDSKATMDTTSKATMDTTSKATMDTTSKATMDTYATIVKKKYNIGYDDENTYTIPDKHSEIKTVSRCIYDEVCSKEKLCGDCAADEFESQQNEETWENFRLDRKIELSKSRHFY